MNGAPGVRDPVAVKANVTAHQTGLEGVASLHLVGRDEDDLAGKSGSVPDFAASQ